MKEKWFRYLFVLIMLMTLAIGILTIFMSLYIAIVVLWPLWVGVLCLYIIVYLAENGRKVFKVASIIGLISLCIFLFVSLLKHNNKEVKPAYSTTLPAGNYNNTNSNYSVERGWSELRRISDSIEQMKLTESLDSIAVIATESTRSPLISDSMQQAITTPNETSKNINSFSLVTDSSYSKYGATALKATWLFDEPNGRILVTGLGISTILNIIGFEFSSNKYKFYIYRPDGNDFTINIDFPSNIMTINNYNIQNVVGFKLID